MNQILRHWKQLLGIAIAVGLGLSPTPSGATAPTLPTSAGQVLLDLNPGAELDPVPFQGPFNPAVGGPCSVTTSRSSCFFLDSANSSDVWHWETTITNTSGALIVSLPISFSAGSAFSASGLLSLAPGSTALFTAIVNDTPETSSRTWLANVTGSGLPSFSIDTAIWEPTVFTNPALGSLSTAFFTGQGDNFVFAPYAPGGLDTCILDADIPSPSTQLCPELSAVPEPSTFLLFGGGGLGLLWFLRRKRLVI